MPEGNSKDGRTGAVRRRLTQRNMVLLALARAAQWTMAKVPYEEIVLQAWRDFPQVFSLRNHPQHPDSSNIHKRLYYDLKPQGLVVSLGNKVFRVTDLGLENARRLDAALGGKATDEAQSRARLARDEQSFIERAFQSRAYSTWRAGEADKLVDYDARLFFQFTAGTPISERKLRVEFAQRAIEKAVRLRMAGADDLRGLSEFLAGGFSTLWREENTS